MYERLSRHLHGGVSALGASRVGPSLALVAMVARSICLAKFGQLSLNTAQVAGSVNPLSLLGAARVADSVDDVLEAGSQVGVAAVRGAKAGIAAAAILCVVGLALDLTSIVYTSRQIHVYRKKKKEKQESVTGDAISEKSSLRSSLSTASLISNDDQLNNNNKIYLKSVDREIRSDYDLCSWSTPTCKRSPSGGELWADVVSSGGITWKDACVEGVAIEPSFSRRSSGSWEKVDYTPDMLIEVDEECLFQNRQFSLEFDPDLMDSVTSADTQQLIVQDHQGNQTMNLPERLARKIKHSFTKEYISERAERLKRYTERLLREAILMERNPTIADLLQECSCRQCTSIGGGSRLYCCHEKRFYWNCVYNGDQTLKQSGDQSQTHNTPSLCVAQHPMFTHLYLTESSLQQEVLDLQESEQLTKELPKHRVLRYCAYRLIVRSCWGNNDIMVKIPDCVRRVVTDAFTPDVLDVWKEKDGLSITDLWEVKDSVTCCVM